MKNTNNEKLTWKDAVEIKINGKTEKDMTEDEIKMAVRAQTLRLRIRRAR